MARDLSSNGYTDGEVRTRLRSGVARLEPRFDLYDIDGNQLDPGLEGVTEAVIDVDVEQAIPTGLSLTLDPDERIRNQPFLYTIVPAFRVQMADGGWAEKQVGAFINTQPERIITGTTTSSERWQLELGDYTQILDVDGPGLNPFNAKAGTGYDDVLRKLLGRAGIEDTTGIVPTDEDLSQTLQWSLQRGARRKKVKKNGKKEWVNLEGRPESWRLIADDLHEDVGYLPPHFALDGIGHYVARPSPDYSQIPPDFTYDTSDGDPVVILERGGLSIKPDFGQVANLIEAVANNKKNEQQTGRADLNDLIPDHPLAERNIRRYIRDTLSVSGNSSKKKLDAACDKELFDAISYWSSVTVEVLADPSHDLFEAVALRVDNDPELGDEPQLFMVKGWKLDLFAATMTLDCRRLYRTL